MVKRMNCCFEYFKNKGYRTLKSYNESDKMAEIKILGQLKRLYDISIDDFLFRKISDEELRRTDKSIRTKMYYEGLYILYYLDTEEFKGSDNKEATESLQYGIIYIYKSKNQKSYFSLQCAAVLGVEDKTEAAELYNKCQSCIPKDNAVDLILNHFKKSRPNRFYHGKLTIDTDHFYLIISHLIESVLMIGYTINEKDGREYIGGLVTVNSISRGRENTPVLQLAGLSRYFLDCNDEELEASLHMRYKIEIGDEADRILGFIKNPLGESLASEEHRLKDDQLKAIISADIEYEIRKIIEKRVYRHYKMLPSEDSMFYHYLSERRKGPTGDTYGQGKY